MEKIEFDYELYLTGDYDLITRSGIPVEHVEFDHHTKTRYVFDYYLNSYTKYSVMKDGNYQYSNHNNTHPLDLLMIQKPNINIKFPNF